MNHPKPNLVPVPHFLDFMKGLEQKVARGEIDGSVAYSQLPNLTTDDVPRSFRANPSFGPSGGKAELEKALARYLRCDPKGFFLTASAMEADAIVVRGFAGKGDEVIVEEPTYDPLESTVLSVGATLVRLQRRWADGFRLDVDRLRRLCTRRTKLIVLTNPHNPSGVALPPGDLRKLKTLAASLKIPVLLDEVFLPASHDRLPRYSSALSPWFISVGSLDKSFPLGHLRVGWISCHHTASAGLKTQLLLAPTLSSLSLQMAALFFPRLDALRLAGRKRMVANQHLIADWARKNGLGYLRPASPNICLVDLNRPSDAPCRDLLKKDKLLVVPGRFFGHPRHIRLSAVMPRARVKRALDLIGKRLGTS
ncbi:MAG: pyridoxal phosphate-dependent aminotransferase [Planctomycetota bacterium]